MNAANAEAVDSGDGDETARGPQRDAASDPDSDSEAAVAEQLRDRAERVRRRELDTALSRLAVDGEVTPAEREAAAALAAGVTDALVERWISRLADSAADPEIARSLFAEGTPERVREEG
ncbi:hypothetical protein [Halorussus sp. AFM4]|uniref:hypothetical protein n=1 Tax=Halorussus sp. AFM4 TaxID=3421651 RepID=UPI003EBC91B6